MTMLVEWEPAMLCTSSLFDCSWHDYEAIADI